MIEWLIVMFPLVFSPGPANIIASISGGNVGIKKSIPLFAGINVIYLSYAIIIGFGLGGVLLSAPQVLNIFKFVGAGFIVWLGILMWSRSKNREQKVNLGFKEGLIIQAMNPKFPVILITMYSVFLNQESDILKQVILLSFSILTLNIFTQFSWASAGKFLGQKLSSTVAAERQDRFFSALLILVGIWIAFR